MVNFPPYGVENSAIVSQPLAFRPDQGRDDQGGKASGKGAGARRDAAPARGSPGITPAAFQPRRMPQRAQSAVEAAGFESDFDSLFLPESDFDSLPEPESPLFSPPPSEPPLPPPRLVP
jgi:hypothetical protein